jgi:DUF4097 and DUF4098 domain-containing protein YvlB
MNQQTIATSLSPEVIIEQVQGSLQVKGWDKPEISIKANPNDLNYSEEEDVIRVSCRGNCTIRLPEGASLQIESVTGDTQIKLLEDQLRIQEVKGTLVLRSVAETHVQKVHGELLAKHIAGDLVAETVMGNAIARDVQGEANLGEVFGNLDLRDVENSIHARAKGQARLRLKMMAGDDYQIEAMGNVHCRIPADASAKVRLESDSQVIKVKLPAENQNFQGETYDLVLGEGNASLQIKAGGMIFLSGQEVDWTDTEEPGKEFGEEFFDFSGGFNRQIARQVQNQIEEQMESMGRQINDQMGRMAESMSRAGLTPEQTEEIIQRARESSERAAARTQERMRRAQEKLERKLEAGRQSWNFEWPSSSPRPAREPVSDEERLMILRMLEQKKITIQEAEELLSALEGKE